MDQDSFVVQSLDEFRHFEASLGWPEGQFLGTQVLLFKPGSEFAKLWLKTYQDYRPSMWYYNAGQLPTESILEKCPGFVKREKVRFGVHNLAEKLYNHNWKGWRDYFAIHLLSRHRDYLAKEDMEESGIEEFNWENIMTYNKSFGSMAREVLEKLDL